MLAISSAFSKAITNLNEHALTSDVNNNMYINLKPCLSGWREFESKKDKNKKIYRSRTTIKSQWKKPTIEELDPEILKKYIIGVAYAIYTNIVININSSDNSIKTETRTEYGIDKNNKSATRSWVSNLERFTEKIKTVKEFSTIDTTISKFLSEKC